MVLLSLGSHPQHSSQKFLFCLNLAPNSAAVVFSCCVRAHRFSHITSPQQCPCLNVPYQDTLQWCAQAEVPPAIMSPTVVSPGQSVPGVCTKIFPWGIFWYRLLYYQLPFQCCVYFKTYKMKYILMAQFKYCKYGRATPVQGSARLGLLLY